jgi:uncharacterized membrane protein YkvA (DUF1232 family)
MTVVAICLTAYAAFVLALVVSGRHQAARAVAGFIPDCIVLLHRLLADERLPRRHKALLVAAVAYLALPFDLVPDFIPVAGQLDDAIVVAVALRLVARRGGRMLIEAHWHGPQCSRALVLRLAA